MIRRRWATLALALIVALGLLPLSPASAARNKPPRIKKAVMKDVNKDGKADRVVLTYTERINHKVDRSRFPFRVQGYKILRVNKARRALKLVILVKPTAKAKAKPDFVKYARTRMQPVKDLKGLQAAKQLLTRNIIGLTVTSPPPAETTQHRLTVSKNDGGSVTSNPTGINCGATCTQQTADYTEGTTVTLTAVPGADSAPEVTWTGCATSTTTTCEVTMDAAKRVDLAFAPAGSRTLAVANEGDGDGTVTSSPTGVNCGSTCIASFDESVTIVTLTATPAAGSKLASWGGDALCPTSSTSCDVLMDGNKTVTVMFELLPVHTLAVAMDATGTGTGSVSSGSDKKIACPPTCSADYPEKTVVTLTATPATGSQFAGWGGDAGCGTTSLTCDVTMSAAKNVTAKFDEESSTTPEPTPAPAKYTIALTVTGNGTVSCMVGVAAVPCDSEFDPGTIVALTATATDLLTTTFSGWSGHCSGILPTCALTMDANKTVGATFTTATTGGLL